MTSFSFTSYIFDPLYIYLVCGDIFNYIFEFFHANHQGLWHTFSYSLLSNNRAGWNKRAEGANFENLIKRAGGKYWKYEGEICQNDKKIKDLHLLDQ